VGGANERGRRKFVWGSGGIIPQNILKSRGSEMVFSAFSMRYFFKKNIPWTSVKCQVLFVVTAIFCELDLYFSAFHDISRP